MSDIATITLVSSVAVAILTYGIGFSYTLAVTICAIAILIGIALAELLFLIVRGRDDPLSPLNRIYRFRRDTDYEWEFDRA